MIQAPLGPKATPDRTVGKSGCCRQRATTDIGAFLLGGFLATQRLVGSRPLQVVPVSSHRPRQPTGSFFFAEYGACEY